jgi:hypothetical protein
MPLHLVALNDKALLEHAQNGSDEAAELLSKRFFGKLTPAVRNAWPSLRQNKHISIHAARRILAEAEAAVPADPSAPVKL